MIAEFVGGPWCGELRAVPDRPLELYYAVPLPLPAMGPAALDEPLRVGVYRLHSWDKEHSLYRWMGET